MPARRIRSSSTTSSRPSTRARGCTPSTRAGRRRPSGPTAGSASTSGRDIALANAMAREIIAAGLENREFIERATVDFEAYKAKVESYTLEYAERETGVPAEAIRELAHAFATAPRAMICWTLGHHRAPQRGRQRPGPHLAGAADRPRRALRQRRQPAAWPEQRPGRRRHGRAAGPPAGLPARRERRAAREVRRRVGRPRPAEARLAPVGHVRRHGARRPDGGLLHRREPGPVRGRPEAGDRACSRASTSSSSRTCS